MAEVTRVPLQPIAKGSLTKLWLGVLIAILIGAGAAWAALPKSLSVETLVAGSGPTPQDGQMVFIKYKGSFPDGEVFDESQPLPFDVGDLIPEGTPFPIAEGQTIEGFQTGLKQMQKGGKYELYIPSEQGYGDEDQRNPQTGEVTIPAGSDLVFEVEVVDILSEEDFQRRVATLQQMMQEQGGPGGSGGPGGPPPQGGPAGPPPGPPPGQ